MSPNMQYTMKSMMMTPKFEGRLRDVNGVVVPSKIPPGGQTYKKKSQRSGKSSRKGRSKMICIICDSDCLDLRGLRNHFVPCVDRNGNPTGARWDDGLNSAAAPARPLSTRGSGSQDPVPEDPQSGNYENGKLEEDLPGSENIPSDSFENVDPQPAFAPLDGLLPFDPGLQQIDPQLAGSLSHSVQPLDPRPIDLGPQLSHLSPNSLESYEPHLRMDVQTNEALLSMLQDWQNIIHDGWEQDTLEHPRFHELMNELIERDLMSAEWTWNVDFEEMNMCWTRVAVEDM